MNTTLYKDGRPCGEFDIDLGVVDAARTVRAYIQDNEMLALGGLCLAPDQQQADAIRGGGKFAPALMAMLGELHMLKGSIAQRDATIAQLRTALAAAEKRASIAEANLKLADALLNKERGLPPDVITVQAAARILDWEGSRGIVTPANEQGKDESK